MHNIVYLSLGSNVGDRAANLNAAINRLRTLGEVVQVSSLYETEPVEFTAQPWFLNCAVELNTEKTPQELMAAILEIEQRMEQAHPEKRAALDRHRHSAVRGIGR